MRTHLTARAAGTHTARAIGLVIAALAAGCGGSSDAMERQLGEMRADLVKMRADHAVLADRLEALERAERAERAGAPRAQAAAEPRRPSSSDRPDLEVVRLVPASDADPPPPAAPPPPPRSAHDAATESSVGPTELPEMADGPRPVLRSTRDGGVTADAPGAPRPRLSAPPPAAPIRSSSAPNAPKRTP